MRVLFICTGNTCRSPMAEYIFNEVSGDFDSASSCGFAAMPGDTINENSLAALAEIGIDASYHRSRRFDLYMADEADFLFVFTPAAKKELEVIFAAVAEISRLTLQSFEKSDPGFADAIEALEETVDRAMAEAAVEARRAETQAELARLRQRREEEKKAEARLRSSLKGKVPCVGMSEKNISSTSLGSYSSKSTGQYYSVGKNYSYNTYNFSDGKRIIFSARCENGVVTEVSDYRGNANIIVPKYDDSDRYDASSYRNAEDFYDDNYYAFHDYYQAEKYWREHRAG